MIDFKNATYASPDATLFADFAEETEEGGSLPYAQIIAPVNLTESQIRKNKVDVKFGLFVSQEQADAVGFTPDARWEAYTAEFGTEEVTEVSGYLTTVIDCFILHRSAIEVQQKIDDKWRFVGLGYDRSGITPHGELAKDREDFRLVNRLLIILLGADGQPLHDAPLQLTARGGFGGAFGSAIKDFYREADQAYAKAARASGQKIKGARLNDFAKAHVRFVCELDRVPKTDTSPYVCVKSRIAVNGVAGQTKVIKQGDREITLTTVTIDQIMVPKNSDLGERIKDWFYENESFGEPNRGMDAPQATDSQGATTGGSVDAHGFFNWGALNYIEEGATAPFTDESGNQYLALIGPDVQNIIEVAGTVHVTGTDNGTHLVIESANALNNAAEADAGAMPVFG